MTQLTTIKNNDLQASFLATGDLYALSHQDILLNQLHGNTLDGSLNQIYLRVWTQNGIKSIPMVGSNSTSQFALTDQQVSWAGDFLGVNYRVNFKLGAANTWFWQVLLSGHEQRVDLLYGQDIGNANKGAVQANEAYISQYVDHHITQTNEQIVISSRQNQPQNNKFPLIEQGSFWPLKSFATDGYQFFGKSYKETNQPQALTMTSLPNEVYQYEFAYIALQTQPMFLTQESTEIVFYGAFKDSQEQAVTSPVFSQAWLQEEYDALTFTTLKLKPNQEKSIGATLVGQRFTDEEINQRFPKRLEEEIVDNQLYSFFTDTYQHVVLKEKEHNMERAHGHILLSGTDLTVEKSLLSTTVYMYGIFNSQIVLGNTSMNKLSSNSRNALNIFKHSGQRLYLEEAGKWRLLTLPSLFVMGLNSATWYYKTSTDVIRVTTYTVADGREIKTEVTSENEKCYNWALSNHWLMSPSEESVNLALKKSNNTLVIGSTDLAVLSKYPDLTYRLTLDQSFEQQDEALFGCVSQKELVVLKINETPSFKLATQASFTSEVIQPTETTKAAEATSYGAFIDDLLNHFELIHPTAPVERMNILARWYTHNMLVHYLSPHGLEQFGGAAWGTRDVSQGPTEFFLATNHEQVVASIIQTLFENQFADDGNWPQWFMFDRYEEQKADESHGDIIIWPLKVVADYLEKTHDFAILEQKLAYTQRSDFKKTLETFSLLDHIKKEVEYIKTHFLYDTYLSSYGDGDWDDTLQPQNTALKEKMVSSWTVALTYQVLKKFAELITEVAPDFANELTTLVAGVKKDYQKYIAINETLPGFVYLEDLEHPELMIHPTDKKTGIQYRLLPMQRSMIAELLTPEQVAHHLAIIEEHLCFPDGVHLMNRPATYAGGVSTNFKRAEQAANFGREIGLQYVHAHIRFVEAMAKIGKKEETWKGLETISPIGLKSRLENAEIRQSNAYFSSSDGKFATRYEAQENFGKLRTGEVAVKGGWRIYSSGPGIYLNQLITNVLGIRETATHVIFDPVLPDELDGLVLKYRLLGHLVTFEFSQKASDKGIVLNEEALDYTLSDNPYRVGGYVIAKESLKEKLTTNNYIKIVR